jgi:Uma2 family endonuclease
MNVHAPQPMTVDEFLRWSLEQESGRYELEGGRVIQMQSQNLAHVRTKQLAYQALADAIERAGLPFYAMPDGPSIRIEGNRCYDPDALVAALPMPPADSLEVPNPIIVVEVLSSSPSSIRRDLQTKLVGYGLVATLQHYVIVDPDERIVFRFRRQAGQLVATEELAEDGTLRLDPPGLEIPVKDMLTAEAAPPTP